MAALWVGACAKEKDRVHVVRISVPDQQLAVYQRGTEVARYRVSTSKFGLGDVPGSNCTPLGKLEVAEKIGTGAPLGMKFKDRRPTGEIVPVNAPGRDPIVTRILWLRGLEQQNANAFKRMIYIHGTPEEARLGAPASFGCIRMRSEDVVALYDRLGNGAEVEISTVKLPRETLPEKEIVRSEGITAEARVTPPR
ncbi:MAG: L,D-transpeptidase [Verrucomicrobia bacterium]|nr:L,D-transpeptidase [Verrucomicrobiota bacterium]